MFKKIYLTGIILLIYSLSLNLSNNLIIKVQDNKENIKNMLLYYQEERKEEIEYYIGILNIPKINLKRGFYSEYSKLNNVNKNIYLSPKSNDSLIILASHRGNSNVSYFNKLEELKIGDEINLDYKNSKYKYILTNIYNEPKDGLLNIYHEKDKKALILITCNRLDKNSQTIYVSYRKED